MKSDIGGRPGNLPPVPPGFVGRAAELADIDDRLRTHRLVTVTGVGGVGKTRTVLQASDTLRACFPDGIWLVRLSPVRDGALLPHAVGMELRLQDQTTRPMIDVLADYLADRRSLLILDTCEHLVDSCAMLATALLQSTEHLRIVAVSRQSLRVRGESLITIAPFPTAAGAPCRDAADLFTQRASAAVPGFAVTAADRRTIARICHRLDGLPLALELAAALVREHTIDDIAANLEARFDTLARTTSDAPNRHDTLRAAVGWSHELCAPAERLLWARASVFAGSFTADAARSVCVGGPLTSINLPSVLDALVDKSILLKDGSRYRFLDTIREYGATWLTRLDEANTVRRRHRDHYLSQARQAYPHWTWAEQVTWCQRITDDIAEIRLALETSLAEPGSVATEMAGALWFLWFSCGHLREGREYLERALAHDAEPGPLRVRAAWAYGCVLLAQGDFPSLQLCIDICRASRHLTPEATVAADYLDGARHALQGDHEQGIDMLSAIDARPERGGIHEVTWIQVQAVVSLTLVIRGSFAEASAMAQEIRDEGARRDEAKFLSWGHYVQALADLNTGQLGSAESHARAAFENVRRLGDSWGMALALDALAMATAALGQLEAAARLLGAGERLWQLTYGRSQLGSPQLMNARRACEQQIRTALGDTATDTAFHKGLTTEAT
ncbi:ATP-binding protein [Actinomadura sp. 3N508]|uniref:ATP-binding protein n=1 Tax=Actinomadura sp. 3N508 TaxID=3375153 RepID=UPI0037B45941